MNRPNPQTSLLGELVLPITIVSIASSKLEPPPILHPAKLEPSPPHPHPPKVSPNPPLPFLLQLLLRHLSKSNRNESILPLLPNEYRRVNASFAELRITGRMFAQAEPRQLNQNVAEAVVDVEVIEVEVVA